MTNDTPVRPAAIAPMAQVSINDSLPSSSPSPRSTLIGFLCVVSFITLFGLYWKFVGF